MLDHRQFNESQLRGDDALLGDRHPGQEVIGRHDLVVDLLDSIFRQPVREPAKFSAGHMSTGEKPDRLSEKRSRASIA